jgi:hypothetical protein
MNEPSVFTISRKFTILQPVEQAAFFLPVEEWNDLKDKVGKIEDDGNLWHTIGGVLVGIAGSAFFGALAFHWMPPKDCMTGQMVSGGCSVQETANYTPAYLCWGLFAATGLSGGLSFFFGSRQVSAQRTNKQGVLSDMDRILKRYEKPTDPVQPS